ncbi:hypothetical protein [Nonomuraea sp. NPDC050691]|uniref:hypothetical protein n=1 Tax=Nonomuraea sp. NPDC050691 TaxID=3155661 RepID=UPI0033E5C287
MVAAAAGTVGDPAARDALISSFVVFLDGLPEVLAERMLSAATGRTSSPLWSTR